MKSTTVLSAKWSKNANKPFISLSWGNREEDIAYERGAIRRAESLNIAVRRFLLPADASQQELIQTLRTVNEDSSIHGCLLFRPLPPHLDTEAVTSVLAPEKDIDAITTASMGGLLTKSDIGFPPCTATACLELLHYYDIPLKGKKIAMIGKSATVGLPTALLLMKEEATVSVCHIFTDKEDTRSFCQDADIIISAAGFISSMVLPLNAEKKAFTRLPRRLKTFPIPMAAMRHRRKAARDRG